MEIENTQVDNQLITLGFEKEYLIADGSFLAIYKSKTDKASMEITCSYEEEDETVVLIVSVVKLYDVVTKKSLLIMADIPTLLQILMSVNSMGLHPYVAHKLTIQDSFSLSSTFTL